MSSMKINFVRSIGHAPRIGDPYALSADQRGNVFVADRINGNIIKISSSGRMNDQLFKTSKQLASATAITVVEKGQVLVGEERGEVQRYSQRGDLVKSWSLGPPSAAGGPAGAPAGLAADKTGNVYVSDQVTNAVHKYDAQGNVQTTIGGKGNALGQFLGPRGLSVDTQGNLYVADEFNNRIQKF